MNLDLSNHCYEPRDAADVLKPEQVAALNCSDAGFTASMHGSLTSFNFSQSSLNLDSLTVADLNHFSVRSLPAMNIAHSRDAPWNESPASLQHHTRMTAPPPGVSPLDHLQNSILSLNVGGVPSFIVDEEFEGDGSGLNDSLASLGLADLDMNAGNTARTPVQPYDSIHSHPSRSSAAVQMQWASQNDSYASSAASSRYASHRQLLSNPGDDDDDEDDDNVEIIKMLRRQVVSMKEMLTAAKLKSTQHTKLLQQQVQQQEGWSASPSSLHDSCSSFSGYAYDSFASMSMGDEVSGVLSTKDELSQAESGIQASIAHLKASMERQAKEQAAPSSNDTIQLFKDKLVLSDIDSNVKVLQREQAAVQQELRNENEHLSQQAVEQNARIAELERQLNKRKHRSLSNERGHRCDRFEL
jgi:hypothetical protein